MRLRPVLRTVSACAAIAASFVIGVSLCACHSSTRTARSAEAPSHDPSVVGRWENTPRTPVPLLGDIPLQGHVFRAAAADSGGASGFVSRHAVADASCLPPLADEVWIIQRPGAKTARVADDVPGCGALMTSLPDEPTKPVPVPLKHTDVKASITGAIASVEVTQQFFNPFSSKIEAVYVFPLPENAAVNDFLMTVGDRHIRGVIREREEAQRIYNEARAQGYKASILTQERPNIFTQKVANIEPGKGIDISIRYFNTLAYSDGEFEFVFPMVVGPRFNPPHTTDGVYARPEGTPRQDIWSDKATEVQYLHPTHRSGHDIGVEVAIDTGAAPIESITCRSHVVDIERSSSGDPGRAIVRLRPSDSVPNKDFVLRYKLAGDGVRSSAIAFQDERAGYLSLMLVPPAKIKSVKRRPLEMVFVLDCSGSMSGEPLTSARRAIERALRRLEPDDTFQVIRFSNSASTLGPAPIPATPDNIRRGLNYLATLESEGGTMMIEGVRAALNFPHDPSRLRFVCFLTDGYIGNEDDILAEVHSRLGASRIFSFGIGTSVNRYLMDSMARLGRGAVAYLAAGDSATDIMDAFMERISHAPMTDISVEFIDLSVEPGDIFPSRIPDLFAGRPVMVSARLAQGGLRAGSEPSVRIIGNVGGERVSYTVPVRVNASGAGGSLAALSCIWARHKIADLADAGAGSGVAEVAGSIKQVALEFGLMSPYTAFLAVDTSERTEGTYGTTVQVPVPVPQGVRYDTTVVGDGRK